MVPRPASGRVYETSRRVRVADADPTGRLRLDAVARFVQDIGNEDVADAGLDPNIPWVVRRSYAHVDGWPQIGDRLAVATWCGGVGSRWAERRVSFTNDSGACVDIATLVIHLDKTGRPSRLPAWFDELYAEAAQGPTLSSRLTLPSPGGDAKRRVWPLRSTDLDVMGHVNNAVTWAAIEDECDRRGVPPTSITVEWWGSLERDDPVELATGAIADDLGIWLVVGGDVRVASACGWR